MNLTLITVRNQTFEYFFISAGLQLHEPFFNYFRYNPDESL